MTEVHQFDRDKQLIERIEKLMANPPEGSVVMEITPAVAKHILANWRGTHNRREKPNAIKRYRLAMESGEWMLNGSTIVFTDHHLLGDGQNRVMACVRAEKPFKTHVVFGADHECFYTIDQGRVRSPDDILQIEGVANSRVIAQGVRWAELLETGKTRLRTVFNAAQILDLYRRKHKAVEDFLPEARRIATRNRQPVGMVAGILYHLDKVDGDFTALFSEAWADGIYEPRFQAIGRMQTELLTLSNIGSGRIHEVVRIAMILNAWNSARAGRKGGVRWDQTMPFPVIK